MKSSRSLALVLVAGLAACAGKRIQPADNEPTLKTLTGRQVVVDLDKAVDGSPEQAIAAYKRYLEATPHARNRAEALRRLGDLEMDRADDSAAAEKGAATLPDYRAAIARYNDFLKAYPKDPGNDRVLYQLARAQELGGELQVAQNTLDRLIQEYPGTRYRDEVNFRRGELLFTARDYTGAEKAYAAVLAADNANTYRERSLYMHGWSLFKQGRLADALHSFFGVLDRKLGGRDGDGDLDSLAALSRADRELVEDTFRVTSLSLENLQGAETIQTYITTAERRSYEYRLYQQLGELYIKQERIKDAADTFGAFARLHPLHAQAPLLQTQVIEIYERTGFANAALDAKKQYVTRYGIDSEFRRANARGWERAQSSVKSQLAELARHYHASAQKGKAAVDYQEATRWYRAYLDLFPNDVDAAQNNFLLAELLFEDGRLGEAAIEYEKTAYHYPVQTKSADAGYSALLAYAEQERRAVASEATTLQRLGLDSALRFAKAFPTDPRTGLVLTTAAEKLFALHDIEQAAGVAQQVLTLQPPAAAAQRRVAWTVIAHAAFERGAFDDAERGYAEVIALAPENDPGRGELVERLAASVYKQGEQARSAGQARAAVAHFTRVAALAPQSRVRPTAQYDAAAVLIGLKDWNSAARTLEDFRQRYPSHPLQEEVGPKLALAYLEQDRWADAAGEFERLAGAKQDPKLARDALWQAGELYEKAGARTPAARVYERFLQQDPQPLEIALEARSRLARIARAEGNSTRELALLKEIHAADLKAGSARTGRTRMLGANAALALAEPVLSDYRKVQLVEPLARQLKLKKAKMEEALKAYASAAEYGVADVTTAATYQTAALYQDFGKALLASQRPRKLSKTELEQYNVMLEEQAYPFEEKATELHEANARRSAGGLYDQWVKSSFKALRELLPVRYGKAERGEGVIDAIQ
jgi:TolA-binding protein